MNNSTEKLPEHAVPTFVYTNSDFPDEILCHILSFMDKKEMVATSILSKRWKFLWTYVDTLELNLITELKFEEVNRILQRHAGPLKRMSIVGIGREHNKHDVVTWIQTAVSKGVETLHLSSSGRSYKWPLCLFHSQTLVELKLDHADISNINIHAAPSFPNLKKLSLFLPYWTNDSLNCFISGCSKLEHFNLCFVAHEVHSVEKCYISSGTLKHCQLISYFQKIVLNTPALEVLEAQLSPYLELLLESSMPSLHNANISISLYEIKYLEFLSNVSALRCEANRFYIYPKRMNLPVSFNNLTRLEIADRQFGLDLLKFFMEKSNNLKAITLEKFGCVEESGEIWEEPQHVPKCLLSVLQSVSIYGYHHNLGFHQNVEEMIKYILGNAKALKRLEIGKSSVVTIDYEFKLHMLQKVSLFPKASVICEISIN